MEGGLLSLRWNNHLVTLQNVLATVHNTDVYSDVSIACGGKFFSVHKLVLASCSEYFSEIFEHTTCKHPVIVLKDVHPRELEFLLNYIYLGEVSVVQSDLPTLVKCAEFLKIKGLAVPDDCERNNSHKILGQANNSPVLTEKHNDSVLDTETNHHDSLSSNSASVKERSPSETQHTFYNSNKRLCLSDDHSSYESSGTEQLSKSDHGSQDISHNSSLAENKIVPYVTSSDNYRELQPPVSLLHVKPEYGCEMHEYEENEENSTSLDYNEGGNESSYNNCEDYLDRRAEMPSSSSNSNVDVTPEFAFPFGGKCGVYMNPLLDNIFTKSQLFSSLPPKATVYSCSVCPYETKHKFNLTTHMRIHSGEKPFSCQFCEYASYSKSNLNKHVKIKHLENANDGSASYVDFTPFSASEKFV